MADQAQAQTPPVAPATESQRPSASHPPVVIGGQEVRDLEAFARSQWEANQRLTQKAGQAEELTKKLEEATKALDARTAAAREKIVQARIDAALASVGVDDEEVRRMLRSHLAATVEAKWAGELDLAADYQSAASAMAAKLKTSATPASGPAPVPPLPSAAPAPARTWQEHLAQQASRLWPK